MSSVWDDPETEIDLEEVTPLPEQVNSGIQASPVVTMPPEQLETLTTQVVEKVVREIVPELAEKIIREKLDEMLSEEKN